MYYSPETEDAGATKEMERKTAERGQIKGKIEGRERYVRRGWKFKQWENKKVLDRYFFRSSLFDDVLHVSEPSLRYEIDFLSVTRRNFLSSLRFRSTDSGPVRSIGFSAVFFSIFREVQISSCRRSVTDKFSARFFDNYL